MHEFFLLLTAGLLGGVVNTVAGGGSFITFPALLAVGVPPVAANATNTFASLLVTLAARRVFVRHCGHIAPGFTV